MASNYTYDMFRTAAQKAGMLNQFSPADMALAEKHPEAGLSLLSFKKDYARAKTNEAKILANEGAEAIRKSYANYYGGADGSGYYSEGKLPGQIDTALDEYAGYGSFSFADKQPTYDNAYKRAQQQALDAVLNRPDFSWSKESDPSWAAYKKQYNREGQRATADALGTAAAASGGRVSSAAMTAASQAGDYYAGKLADKVPELEANAYNRYLNDFSMDVNKLGVVNQQEQMDYQKYLDALTQYNTNRNFGYQQYVDRFNMMGNQLAALQGQDNTNYDRNQTEIERELEAKRLEQQYAREQADAILAAGGMPGAQLAAAAGISGDYSTALRDAWQRKQTAEALRQQQEAQEQQQTAAKAQVDAMLAAGAVPGAELVAASGYPQEYISAMSAYYKRLAAQEAQAAQMQSVGVTARPESEGFRLETLYSQPTEAAAYAYLVGQNLSNDEATRMMQYYIANKNQQITPDGSAGSSLQGSTVPLGEMTQRQRYDEISANTANRVDSMYDGTIYVAVDGFRQTSLDELMEKVASGEIIEEYDSATGKFRYRKASR